MAYGGETIRNKHILIVGISCQIQPRNRELQLNRPPHTTVPASPAMFFVPRQENPNPRGAQNELRNLHEVCPRHTKNDQYLQKNKAMNITHLWASDSTKQDAGSSCSWYGLSTPLPTAGDLRRNAVGEDGGTEQDWSKSRYACSPKSSPLPHQ